MSQRRARLERARERCQRIGANVRAEIARAGKTQDQIADMLRISQAGVSLRLAGRSPFHAHELDTLAEELGVPVATFYATAPAAAAA
jgi:transcriptional regulator with XRE-family HTH domain